MNNLIHHLQSNLGNTNATNTKQNIGITSQNNFVPTQEDNRNDNRKINEALRLLGNNITFDGNEREWMEHKARLKNVFWSLELNKNKAIKLSRLSCTGKALFMMQNIDPDLFLQEMNGNALDSYLNELENLFIGSASKELSRVKFQSAKQDHKENVSACVTRIKILLSTAYPDEDNLENNENVKH